MFGCYVRYEIDKGIFALLGLFIGDIVMLLEKLDVNIFNAFIR